ncbi:extensin [Streptomyces sp. NPDC056672]|uniref:extensin n=1 Tax=Streptomyces sp. NPDC056672 TaxID=3345906 RepID=UPI0036B08DF7
MKRIDAREAISLLRSMTRVLCAVGLLALVFTTVNVTRFATSRDVPLPIAVLLDPMIGTALAGVLYVDARLASWGIRPPAWSITLRWSAGCTAALMNSWESLWPDGQIGWPRRADPAAVLLHLTPALLLIALTETIAAYRRCVTDLLDQVGSTECADKPIRQTAFTSGPIEERPDLDTADPDPLNAKGAEGGSKSHPGGAGTAGTNSQGHTRSHTGDRTPHSRPAAHGHPSIGHGAPDADVWPRAVTLNGAALATTGNPVSVWRLRTDLRIGPRRARQIRERLLTQRPDPPPPAE